MKQTIGYMKNVTLPPTRNDVVMETVKVSQQIACECGETLILVHYDLAVAKSALIMQNQKSLRFDKFSFVLYPSILSLLTLLLLDIIFKVQGLNIFSQRVRCWHLEPYQDF